MWCQVYLGWRISLKTVWKNYLTTACSDILERFEGKSWKIKSSLFKRENQLARLKKVEASNKMFTTYHIYFYLMSAYFLWRQTKIGPNRFVPDQKIIYHSMTNKNFIFFNGPQPQNSFICYLFCNSLKIVLLAFYC